ncbi:hypothetical protein VTK56DRAFT_7448 [Thermocarpiscus australiensis]
MGREKKNAPGAGPGRHAKERHKKDRKGNPMDWAAPLPPGLVARRDRPRISSKHKSWFEFIENKDKKKKLEFEFTENREPPPGFEFVPIGNPALTTACKELSREQGAMIFIVTSSHGFFSRKLSLHLNRVGHHIRQTIVEQARASLGDDQLASISAQPGQPEPIPERQEDINRQADAAIRDLFPRIPNTDRQMIIEHAFNKSRLSKDNAPPVGLASHLTLSRRVQLAVLAHIRHNHTRYDQLLKEAGYVNARKAVEPLCLDFLVKWRGDEETGRDQLDEILCEVVVISDSESDESDEEDDEDESSETSVDEIHAGGAVREDMPSRITLPPVVPSTAPSSTNNSRDEGILRASHAPQKVKKKSGKERRADKWAQRGFARYQAAWNEAVQRQRLDEDNALQAAGTAAVERSVSRGPQPWPPGRSEITDPGLAAVRSQVEPPYNVQRRLYDVSLPVDERFESRSRLTHVDELQQSIPLADYYLPQGARDQTTPRSNGLRPIVGSRPLLQRPPEVERVSYQGQDLKDYLVESIEPASPVSYGFPPRYPFPHFQPARGLVHGVEDPARAAAQPHGLPAPTGGVTAAHGSRMDWAEEGFIRLPPRSEPNRMSVAPDPRSEPSFVVMSQPVSTARSSALAVNGLGVRYLPASRDNTVTRGGGPVTTSDPTPIWKGDDGVILRSEPRPIVIQDIPPRQPDADSAHVSAENRLPSPRSWNNWANGVHHHGARFVEDPNRQPADSRTDRPVETLQEDFTGIVRVSNKFPRQYEPHPARAGAERYDLRSAPPQRSASRQTPARDGAERYDLRPAAPQRSASHQAYDGTALYSSRPSSTQAQRLDRAVNGAEEFGSERQSVPVVARLPERYKSDVQRQERVVGIEYVRARPSLETGINSARGPMYDTGEPVYRSRSASPIPVTYSRPAYQFRPDRTIPRREEFIILD